MFLFAKRHFSSKSHHYRGHVSRDVSVTVVAALNVVVAAVVALVAVANFCHFLVAHAHSCVNRVNMIDQLNSKSIANFSQYDLALDH